MESKFKTSYRTNINGELNEKDDKKEVTLCGWVQSSRDHGGLIFIDLRDRYGITQIVFDPKNKEIFEDAKCLRREDCIQVNGKVRLRPKEMINNNLSTGKIEVLISNLRVLTKSDVPPLEVEDRIEAGEEVRLKYRYLDLRRPIMQKKLIIRHKLAQAVRKFLIDNGFLEIETPFLIKHTPEGARDYVVPSRVHPGKFYSLPQSPQLYKQLLMQSGFDRYFQIVRCFRDEDLRQDRQPEFTQIDIEMACIEEEDIMNLIEQLVRFMVKEVLNKDVKLPLQRITYKDAMENYGNDKPDLRFELRLTDITEIAKESQFKVFLDAIKHGGIVKCINPEKEFSRNETEAYIEFCKNLGAKGMAWMKFENGNLESNIAKYFSKEQIKKLIDKTKIKKGYLFFIADKEALSNEILTKLRTKLADDLNLIKNKEELKFGWVIDFPLFEWNEELNHYGSMHHPFTAPKKEHENLIEKDPGKVLGRHYDLILNGFELGSGSIRIYDPSLQERVLKALTYSKEDAMKKFGFLLEAFKFGAVPHGGIALGFDRLCGLLQGISDIREVIAFPKNKAGQNPMDGCPSDVDEKQLKELHLKLEIVKK